MLCTQPELDYYYLKVTLVTDQEELVKEKEKSVRGCIVAQDLSVLALSIVKQGDNEIEGLTDTTVPKRLGPKRANHIRKFFGLTKEDDVRDFVVRSY